MAAVAWWRKNFLAVELLIGFALTLLFVGWAERGGGEHHIDSALAGHRSSIYGTLAGIFASLFGFVLAAATIVLGAIGDARLTLVRESRHYPQLWDVFTSAIRWLGFAAVASIAGLILDHGGPREIFILYVSFLAAAVAILRVARCVWVLENVIDLVTESRGQSTSNPGPSQP